MAFDGVRIILMSGQVHQKSFCQPETLAPISQVYRMYTSTGMPSGHEAHYHPETVEVCYVCHGCLDWWIGTERFELHAGDLVVMLPGVPHGSADSTLQPCEYYALHFDPRKLGLETPLAEPSFGGRYSHRPDLGEFVLQIFREHEQRDQYSPENCRSLCHVLIVGLVRDRFHNGASVASDFVKSAQLLLCPSGHEVNSVSAVATALNVSTVWLYRKFQQELKISPGEWQRSQRIAEAKRLLTDQRKTVTEVAVILGYRSTQYFATAFRRETGVSPSAYRENGDRHHFKGSLKNVVEARI